MSIRVLSYNIHKGFSLRQEFVLTQIRKAIHTVDADIVFLQEVLGHHEHPSRKIPEATTTAQFEYLADSVWPHFAYGRNAIYDEGHHGNAILSRWPLKGFANTDISNHLFERRGLLTSQIELPEIGAVHLGCLHLDLTHRGRSQQAQKILHWAANIPEHEPLILAGDFNDWRQKLTDDFLRVAGLREVFLSLRGECARTFPSWLPVLSLDRIFIRGLQPLACERLRGSPWRTLSDHLPLFAELGSPSRRL